MSKRKQPLPDIFKPLASIKWKHVDALGFPIAMFENIQSVIDAYRITIARPLLNADDFTPFFGNRYHANCGELVRDAHRAQLLAICRRNQMSVKMRDVERYAQLRGLEIEDQERRKANEKRLREDGAL